jgi:hypothetical protein
LVIIAAEEFGIGVRHHILSFCRPGEGLDELLPVNLILKDVLTPAAPQDMINRAGKFSARQPLVCYA